MQYFVWAEDDCESGGVLQPAAKWTFSGSGLEEGQPQPKDTGSS